MSIPSGETSVAIQGITWGPLQVALMWVCRWRVTPSRLGKFKRAQKC
jgi:hypothetical protein